MKRLIALFLLIFLLFSLCACRQIPLAGSTEEPPMIGVCYGEKTEVLRGASGYWKTRYLFGSSSSIGDAPHPRDMSDIKTFNYDSSMADQEGMICFEKAPEKVSVYCVDVSLEVLPDGEPCEVALLEKEDRYAACYRASLKEGAQYYRIQASWKDGYADYWFRTAE